jgi:quinol monooxygenase YgiN
VIASKVLGSVNAAGNAHAEGFTMVQLVVRLNAAPGRKLQLAEALRRMRREIHGHRGCVDVHVAADVDETTVLWYCEEWDDLEGLERELRTDRFTHLLALVETAAQPPLVEFRVITETRGLEYVASVRGAPAEVD